MREAIGVLAVAVGAVVVVLTIIMALMAYVAPLFGLDPNACTVVVAP